MMDLGKFLLKENEKPLDNIVADGGFCGIFRKIGCIGDSLASGEMESLSEDGVVGWHDYYEYSWGQFMARDIGCEVLNCSRGGMTAKEYCESFATANDFWNPEKRCQAYIIAMGANEINQDKDNLGDITDVDKDNWKNNKDSFVGYYAQIIQRLKEIQPKAKFFLVTMPQGDCADRDKAENRHQELMYQLAEMFEYTYVLDIRKYGPVYDRAFVDKFYLAGHMNACGYRLTAKMFESYIDYIIRSDFDSFKQVAFIGKPVHNCKVTW